MSFSSNFKKALLVTTAFVSISLSLKATQPFNEEFLNTAKALEAKHPELFRGFNDTDFVSIKQLNSSNTDHEDIYVQTPTAMFDRLIDRIQRHAGTDDNQLKLLTEMRQHRSNGERNYLYFLDAMFRHAAYLRLNHGQKCDFEKFSTELGREFGERYFHELYAKRPFANLIKTFRIFDEAADDVFEHGMDTVTIAADDDLNRTEGDPVKNIFFPLYNQHDVGVAYLGYMFLNQTFPVAYPEKFGEGMLHGMAMSQYAELVHDTMHGQGFTDIVSAEEFASKYISAYQTFLRNEPVKMTKKALKDSEEAYERQKIESAKGEERLKKLSDDLDELHKQREEANSALTALKGLASQLSLQTPEEPQKAENTTTATTSSTNSNTAAVLTPMTTTDLAAAAKAEEAKAVSISATTSTNTSVEATPRTIKKALSYVNPRLIAPQVLKLMKQKRDVSSEAMNSIFKEATTKLANNTMSIDDYSTLMIGLFNRAHEDYFDGTTVWQSTSFDGLMNAYFQTNEGMIQLKSDKDAAATSSTAPVAEEDKAEVKEEISSVNPFNASFITGKTQLKDEEILDLAARMPKTLFNGNENPSMYTIVDGKVTHTEHSLGVELYAQSGEVLRAAFRKPNLNWLLSSEHDTYLANLGSKGIAGAQPLLVPDLKRHGDNHQAAQEEATAYFASIRARMNDIYKRSNEIVKTIMPADVVSSIDQRLNSISTDIINLFPEEARKEILEDISKED